MNEDYGEFIKHHRILSGFQKQRHFAEKSGVSPASMSRIEKGLQKPNVELLKTMARYLTSTSYVELMVVCGYWDKNELLLFEELTTPNQDQDLVSKYLDIIEKSKKEKTPTIEEEFLKSVDIDNEDRNQYELKIDGQPLTEEESNGIIAYIRSLRQMKNQNKD